eukprot:6033266-Alexandrium_andersonii.AAC.1
MLAPGLEEEDPLFVAEDHASEGLVVDFHEALVHTALVVPGVEGSAALSEVRPLGGVAVGAAGPRGRADPGA